MAYAADSPLFYHELFRCATSLQIGCPFSENFCSYSVITFPADNFASLCRSKVFIKSLQPDSSTDSKENSNNSRLSVLNSTHPFSFNIFSYLDKNAGEVSLRLDVYKRQMLYSLIYNTFHMVCKLKNFLTQFLF